MSQHNVYGRALAAFGILCLLGLSTACDSSSGGAVALASSQIDPAAGGMVEVTEGTIAGVKVEFAAGVLAAPVEVAVFETFPRAQPGYLTIGPPVVITPERLSLLAPVQLTLPYSEAGRLFGQLVVLCKREDGEVVEIGIPPFGVDELVTVDVGGFGTFWVAERLFGGVSTRNFIPLVNNTSWVYEGGITGDVVITPDEPNLGTTVARLQFNGTQQVSGHYLTNAGSAQGRIGTFATIGGLSYQLVFDAEQRMLPAQVTLTAPVEYVYTYSAYEPFGSTTAATTGLATTRIVATQPEEVITPLGTYTNVLTLSYESTFAAASGTDRSESFALTLVSRIGPVSLDLFGTTGFLESGMVAGNEITPP